MAKKLKKKAPVIRNSRGQRYFGMHFYPGLAGYIDEDGEEYRIMVAEETIRAMDDSFEGRPVYVEHVDEVNTDVDKLRTEADGYVVKSFYNDADGRHWVEFIVVSSRGMQAIADGARLSNAYRATSFGEGGSRSGVSFDKTMEGGEYDHLALVDNPRYEDSVIMTPDDFKAYNEEKRKALDAKRLANSKNQRKDKGMAFKLFKREAIKNSADLENTMVFLPTVKREVSLEQLMKEADTKIKDKIFKFKNEDLSADAMYEKCKELMAEVADLRAQIAQLQSDDDGEDDLENEDDDDDDVENVEDEDMENEDDDVENAEDEDDEEEKKKPKKTTKNEVKKPVKNDAKKTPKKKVANSEQPFNGSIKDLAAAIRLMNAGPNQAESIQNDNSNVMALTSDMVKRGKERY